MKSEVHAPDLDLSHLSLMRERRVVGMRVDAPDYGGATARILDWARRGESRYVCVANVHMALEARDSDGFHEVVERADMVTPDGMPLVWALRLLGVSGASQVRGTDLTLRVLERAARAKVPVGFYGSTPEVLEELERRLKIRFPELEVACRISPPFRPMTPEEDEAVSEEIATSGARILFVGLGCPRQESWMAAHRDRLPVVMLGVGAAFDFLSGRVSQAPAWMQRVGAEWVFRLMTDPRRLWKRYARHNPRFLALISFQLSSFYFQKSIRSRVG